MPWGGIGEGRGRTWEDAHWIAAKVERQWGVAGEGLEGVERLCGHAHDHGALGAGLDGVGVDEEGERGAVWEGHGGGRKEQIRWTKNSVWYTKIRYDSYERFSKNC